MLFTFETLISNTVVRLALYAFGDVKDPLDETVRILDELTTDFVIETCHKASQVANLSGRQKVKVDDFKFAIRGDEIMLGRVHELFGMDRIIKVGALHKKADTNFGTVDHIAITQSVLIIPSFTGCP